jgi:hypothetical protein
MTEDQPPQPPSEPPAQPPSQPEAGAADPIFRRPPPPEPVLATSPSSIPPPNVRPGFREQFRAASSREQLLLVSTGVLFVVTVLLALMVFAPSIAPIKLGSARQAALARSEAAVEEVAKRFARNFYSIDYRTLESDFETIRSDTTGDLLRQLGQVTKVIREPYRKTRSIVTGRPKRVVIVSLTKDVASVQVTLAITIRNSKKPEPQTRDQPLQLTLIRTGSGWKVSQVYQQPVSGEG